MESELSLSCTSLLHHHSSLARELPAQMTKSPFLTGAAEPAPTSPPMMRGLSIFGAASRLRISMQIAPAVSTYAGSTANISVGLSAASFAPTMEMLRAPGRNDFGKLSSSRSKVSSNSNRSRALKSSHHIPRSLQLFGPI